MESIFAVLSLSFPFNAFSLFSYQTITALPFSHSSFLFRSHESRTFPSTDANHDNLTRSSRLFGTWQHSKLLQYKISLQSNISRSFHHFSSFIVYPTVSFFYTKMKTLNSRSVSRDKNRDGPCIPIYIYAYIIYVKY